MHGIPANLLLSRLQRRNDEREESCILRRRKRQIGRASEEQQNAEKGKTMIYKRGQIYWYKFTFNGEAIRESTRQGNHKRRAQIWKLRIARRWRRAKWGYATRNLMTLAEFCDNRFEPWAKATFGKSSPKTWLDFYRVGLRAARNYRPLASLRLDEITSERAAEFAAYRQSQGLQVSTVNSSLRVLRRMLRLAVEWGELQSAPTIKRLPGERHRERVVSYDEEARYLAAASELLASIATVLIDTGMRPEECYRLRWESITWVNGRNGTLLVTHGKTAAARRVLPMTPRVRAILESRWERTGRPLEGWVWPAADLEWACRTVQPQETAQKGSAAGWCSSVCVVQPPPHFLDAARRVGV